VVYVAVLYRVSFYELMVDDGNWQKQKSSGVLICPGTGSTSWHFNVNHVSFQKVQEILEVGKNGRVIVVQLLDSQTETLISVSAWSCIAVPC